MEHELAKKLHDITIEILELSKDSIILALGYCEIIKNGIIHVSEEDWLKYKILDYKDL